MSRWIVVLVASLAILAWGAAPGAARPADGGAVVLPVYLEGTYQPVTSTQFTDTLATVMKKAGRGADVLRISQADLAKAGFQTPEVPPSSSIAQGLCQQTGKRFCIWMSLALDATMGSNYDHLAMAGTSRFWAYDSQTGVTVINAPVTSLHSASMKSGRDPEELQRVTGTLVNETVEDLALQIVALTDQETANQRVQAWQAAAAAQDPTPAPPSAAYTNMLKACQDYASAVSQSDLIATRDALSAAYSWWPQLNAKEQEGIESRYPGTTQWMNGGAWYGGSVYYYPPLVPRR